MDYKKKLIEVALPLEAINRESSREKSIRHGHPSTLHLWWARRPLAACRAVLFASLVDDPSAWPQLFPTEADQQKERLRLFEIIEKMVKWENTTNSRILNEVKAEIARSIARNNGDAMPRNDKDVIKYLEEKAPPVMDPFCGGGSIPLEAQRLGLRAYASDLNPVPVLITKALIEIPPKFTGKPPVNPDYQKKNAHEKAANSWERTQGLAEDVRFYGQRMRDEAEKRIGKYYPSVKITPEMIKERPDLKSYEGEELKVIAWIWARTVESPNPAFSNIHVPLIKTFWLSKKKWKEAWVEPLIDIDKKIIKYVVRVGKISKEKSRNNDIGTKIGRGCKFNCLMSSTPIPDIHVKNAGLNNKIGSSLIAIIAEGKGEKIYISPNSLHESTPLQIKNNDTNGIDSPIAKDPRALWCVGYGIDSFEKLFTPRQLLTLTTFSDLVNESHERIWSDASKSEIFPNDTNALDDGGIGARAYADALVTYLSFVLGRQANYSTTLNVWSGEFIVQTFGRQALPMVWDYAETNPFSDSTGNWNGAVDWVSRCLDSSIPGIGFGIVKQLDAMQIPTDSSSMISTDPPYYDNIGYADLSDFFYIWHRRTLNKIYPQLFSTMLTPKSNELIASPYRHNGDKHAAQVFFEDGLGMAFDKMRQIQNNSYPLTVFYAFKQSEDDNDDDDIHHGAKIASTGWDTMLSGLIQKGFLIQGTWPLRTERDQGLKTGTNVLASSIVLVCRPRAISAIIATRKDFITALQKELPLAIHHLQQGYIAPVDLAQASIGPGMAIYSRYSKVLEADGSAMPVRTALHIINQELDAYLSEQEGELDRDTRFCIDWFTQYGMNEAAFGEADTLARAKNTSVQGLVEAGVAFSKGGKMHLLNRSEYPDDWDPTTDERLTVWKCTQQLIRVLEAQGESKAAELVAKMGGRAEDARALAYRIFAICERKNWAQEALSYNSLVIAWPELMKLTRSKPVEDDFQGSLL